MLLVLLEGSREMLLRETGVLRASVIGNVPEPLAA
jgi:hypothetical protein